MPYPPNKGDKIRSYHLLKHLAANHDIHLGCFVDDPDDLRHIGVLEEICKSVFVRTIRPSLARIKSLAGLFSGDALSVHYYSDRPMQAWVQGVVNDNQISAAVAYSSPMAQFISGQEYSHFPRIMDFVDVDSEKWRQYAANMSGPMRRIYAREASKLANYERQVSCEFDASVFVSQNEVRMFEQCCPETRDKQHAMGNGVATEFFDPDQSFETPFSADTVPILFTGAMDYWPNVDAVT
jgi:sugar transferase (PEP-CTERM/EpsH1 system associated)